MMLLLSLLIIAQDDAASTRYQFNLTINSTFPEIVEMALDINQDESVFSEKKFHITEAKEDLKCIINEKVLYWNIYPVKKQPLFAMVAVGQFYLQKILRKILVLINLITYLVLLLKHGINKINLFLNIQKMKT